LAILAVLGFALAACQAGAGYDRREISRRMLQGGTYDYYYGAQGDPVANDPDFTYGWDIGP
jgi:hypothetical protein